MKNPILMKLLVAAALVGIGEIRYPETTSDLAWIDLEILFIDEGGNVHFIDDRKSGKIEPKAFNINNIKDLTWLPSDDSGQIESLLIGLIAASGQKEKVS